VAQNVVDDGYPALTLYVFTTYDENKELPLSLFTDMVAHGDEGHFRFAAFCDPSDQDDPDDEGGNDGFNAFVVLDFNDPNQAAARKLATTYLGSDIAFGIHKGAYGLKHI